jgi:hypothetical protein
MIVENWRVPDGSFVRRVVDMDPPHAPRAAFHADGTILRDDDGDMEDFGTRRLASQALFPGGAGYMLWCGIQEVTHGTNDCGD